MSVKRKRWGVGGRWKRWELYIRGHHALRNVLLPQSMYPHEGPTYLTLIRIIQGYSNKKRVYEEYGYVLDVKANVRGKMPGPIVQLVGEKYLMLLEAVAAPGRDLKYSERVYIGRDLYRRSSILFVRRRIYYKDLTPAAKAELFIAIEKILTDNESIVVNLINNICRIRMRACHVLDLLRDIRCYRDVIVDEARKREFASLDDFQARTGIPAEKLIKALVRRLKLEFQRLELEFLSI